jgi:hypothetical protein
MTPEIIGTLLFRLLGVVMLTLGMLSVLGMSISYFYLVNAVASHDTYFVVGESLVSGGILLAIGALFLIFSKPLGRLLSKGLP